MLTLSVVSQRRDFSRENVYAERAGKFALALFSQSSLRDLSASHPVADYGSDPKLTCSQITSGLPIRGELHDLEDICEHR